MPDDDYPMILTTGRQLEHWHTGAMTRRASVLDTIEPEAVAQLNYRDLKRLGIEAGETVRVATRRGVIELMARVDTRCRKAFCLFHFAMQKRRRISSPDPQLDPYGKIPGLVLRSPRGEIGIIWSVLQK